MLAKILRGHGEVYRRRFRTACKMADIARDLMLPILEWIERAHPSCCASATHRPSHLRPSCLIARRDILISIDLTERVIATPRADGSDFDLQHPAEPPMSETFPDVNNDLIQGWGGTEFLGESEAPGIILTPAIPPDA